MDQAKCDGLSTGIRFTQSRQKMSYWASSNSSTGLTPQHVSKTINPNKAVFTIDANSGHIFIVNNKACQLLGYTSNELRNKPFFDLLNSKSESHINALAEMQVDSDEGTVVLLSGKVIEMKTKLNDKVVVSLWIRQIDSEGRCIAVAEPVERHICQLHIDRYGTVTSADTNTATIFQYETVEQIIGMNITLLIPSIKLPEADCTLLAKGVRKQRATGRTTDNVKFPLCLLITPHEYVESNVNSAYNLTLWVFQNLSGLIVLDDCGNIQTCNQPFSLLMFGYSQEKIQNMHISTLIPNFGKDSFESRSRNVTNSSLTSNEWEAESDAVLNDNEMPLPLNIRNHLGKDVAEPVTSPAAPDQSNEKPIAAESKRQEHRINGKYFKENPKAMSFDMSTKHADYEPPIDEAQTPVNAGYEFPTKYGVQHNVCVTPKPGVSGSVESTPSSASSRPLSCIEGNFIGEAVHADGNVIDIMYTVSTQTLPCSRLVHCVWICRDPNTVFDNDKHTNLTLTFNSFTSTVEHSLGQMIKSTAAQNSSRPSSISLISKYDDELLTGEFSKYYTTLKQIGKGAYGYVKMGFRNSDRLLVITKFILKEKLCSQFMVKNEANKEIPIEVHLLQTLKHPNIVSVIDVFENDLFFQLVMEKHGSGMDLFEFIERRPVMDEKLGSFIFRQIADAVHYLHSLLILHRDIKDENIIIDQNFHIKLIDFGSATFMEEGKMFSTFFGTTEYCSPEVLAGNKYAGPELEMWSLGVTLYVLMFFENPFIDVEETLKAELQIPSQISENLRYLLNSMLHKDPLCRCTMKQLINDPWINQEVNLSLYNFAWIVPCKSHEANPDKYYTGQLYSSTSVLSTISPHESLSLVDECSMGGSEDDERDNSNMLAEVSAQAIDIRNPKCKKDNAIGTIPTTELDDSAAEGITSNDFETCNGCSFGKGAYYSLSKMNVSDMSLDRGKCSVSPHLDMTNLKITEVIPRECDKKLMHAILDNCSLQVKDIGNRLSASKSENSIFREQHEPDASVYNVVSLHDVQIKEPTLNYKLEYLSNLNISNENFDIQVDDRTFPTK